MKKRLAKQIAAWVDADFNRAVCFYPTVEGYQCQLCYMVNGERKWGCCWMGDSIEEAFTEAIFAEEWNHD